MNDDFENGTKNSFECSVVVCTYNSKLSDIYKTVLSIISQKGVKLELIICDDGSDENKFDEIETYLLRHRFKEYKLISNDYNHGTVLNLLSGVAQAKGKWIKAFGPGDYFVDRFSLKKWIDYCAQNDAIWSFARTKSVVLPGVDVNPILCDEKPYDIKPYFKNQIKRCIWNYIVLGDQAHGACIICDRNALIKYLRLIENKVIYAEDMVYRLMTYFGIVGSFYPEYVVCYEIGSGISTSGKEKWNKLLKKDVKKTDSIMFCEINKQCKQNRTIYKAYCFRKSNDVGIKKIYRLFQKGALKLAILRRSKMVKELVRRKYGVS